MKARGIRSRTALWLSALLAVSAAAYGAQARWRAVNAPHLVVLVRAGARFERGILLERRTDAA